MRNIKFLAYKMYSYDTESFINEVLSFSRDSIIMVFDFEKISCYYAPADINIGFKVRRFTTIPNRFLNRLLTPLRFLIDVMAIFSIISWTIIKFRPKICWLENTYAAFIAGVLRKLRFTSKTFYLPGDWLAVKKISDPLAYFGSNILFPLLDYCACRSNDVVLNHSQAIAEARYAFWGRRIANRETLYPYKYKIKVSTSTHTKQRNTLCFLGSPRKDSGLDLAILAISELSKTRNFLLKVIGPKRQHYEYFRELASKLGISSKIQFLGFVDTVKLPSVLSDCFCGLNLVQNTHSYSSFTTPGKIVHYLQYLLPVLVTPGSGPMAKVIESKQLGLMVEPRAEIIKEAISLLFENQSKFRSNIIDYINSQQEISISELIEKS